MQEAETFKVSYVIRQPHREFKWLMGAFMEMYSLRSHRSDRAAHFISSQFAESSSSFHPRWANQVAFETVSLKNALDKANCPLISKCRFVSRCWSSACSWFCPVSVGVQTAGRGQPGCGGAPCWRPEVGWPGGSPARSLHLKTRTQN